MVFHLDRKMFFAARQRRSFGQRPATQHPVLLHAQIEMQTSRGMLMHDIKMPGLHRRGLARRFLAAVEIALALVFIEGEIGHFVLRLLGG